MKMSGKVSYVVSIVLLFCQQLNAGHKTVTATTHHPRTIAKDGETLSSTARVKLHDSLRNILGFHDLPLGSELLGNTSHSGSRRPSVFGRSGAKDQVAPRYMMRLYDQFRAGRVDRQKANTVRSIQPDVVLVNNEGMFLLNLTSIRPTEHVLRSEVHIYRRRHHPAPDVNIDVYAISPGSSLHLATHTFTDGRTGWQTFDVTAAVEHCITQRHSPRCLLGLRVAPNDNSSVTVTRARYSRPYLVIFSNDTLRVSVDHLDPNLVYQADDSYINPGNGMREHFNERNRRRRPTGLKRAPRPKKSARDGHVSQFETRKRKLRETRHRRSIYDNQIPEHAATPVVPMSKYNIPDTDPRILQTRAKKKHTPPKSRLIPYPEAEDDDNDDDVLQTQRGSKKSRRRKNRRRKKNRRRDRNSRVDSIWATDGDGLPYLKANRPREQDARAEMCGRKSLRIDFADIGWADWIIAPKSFEAHYCSGVCQFPDARRLMATNHATLQSLVEAVGILRDIPAPCCAPHKLSSLSLIFFDQSGNVVLKSYDGMTVQSCGCH